MILKELLDYFSIEVNLPPYLLEESFNEVFLKGDFFFFFNFYKIVVKTQKNVTHTMIIKPDSDFPVTVMSELPNGLLNGMKFGLKKGEVAYTNEF